MCELERAAGHDRISTPVLLVPGPGMAEDVVAAVFCSIFGFGIDRSTRWPYRGRGDGETRIRLAQPHAFGALPWRGCGEWPSVSMPRTRQEPPGCTKRMGME